MRYGALIAVKRQRGNLNSVERRTAISTINGRFLFCISFYYIVWLYYLLIILHTVNSRSAACPSSVFCLCRYRYCGSANCLAGRDGRQDFPYVSHNSRWENFFLCRVCGKTIVVCYFPRQNKGQAVISRVRETDPETPGNAPTNDRSPLNGQ